MFDESGADPRGWWQHCALALFFSPVWAITPIVLGITLAVHRSAWWAFLTVLTGLVLAALVVAVRVPAPPSRRELYMRMLR